MKHVLKFFKGSLFATVLLVMAYSPFETEAQSPTKSEANPGIVTSAAVLAPVFEADAFIAQKPAQTPEVLALVEEITPTPVEATPTATLKPTKIATTSAKLIAANIPTGTPAPVVPTSTPVPQVIAAATGAVPFDEFFTKYAAAFNVSKDTLIKIARCESGFREGAVNGPYLGMYQYLADTWSSTRNAMGENPDPALRANAEEAIKTSAWKIAHGGIGAWPVCGK